MSSTIQPYTPPLPVTARAPAKPKAVNAGAISSRDFAAGFDAHLQKAASGTSASTPAARNK